MCLFPGGGQANGGLGWFEHLLVRLSLYGFSCVDVRGNVVNPKLGLRETGYLCLKNEIGTRKMGSFILVSLSYQVHTYFP